MRYRHRYKQKKQPKEKYIRSNGYRKDFLEFNKGYKGDGETYHCAYCGKKIRKEKMEVDHIVAVDAAQKHLIPRAYLKLIGAENINDHKNLVAACIRCNRKKGRKYSIGWIIRGGLGRNIWFWRFLRIFFIIFLACIIIGYARFHVL